MTSRGLASPVRTGDILSVLKAHRRPLSEDLGLNGILQVHLFDEYGNLKQFEEVKNLITDTGDEYYAKKGSAVAINTVTGMKLGTGTTAAAKNGAGANIVTYATGITASKAIDGSFPTAAQISAGNGWRITWQTTWAAGEATSASAWTEVAITNQTALADTQGAASDKISRAVFSAVNKGANDTLVVSWQHNFLGA